MHVNINYNYIHDIVLKLHDCAEKTEKLFYLLNLIDKYISITRQIKHIWDNRENKEYFDDMMNSIMIEISKLEAQ